MIGIKVSGDFKNTETLLEKIRRKNYFSKLRSFGEQGVKALSSATPVDTGVTAASWSYDIKLSNDKVQISWSNSNVTEDNVPIVVLIQNGHITGNGGFVEGVDFINPAIKPIFENMANTIWKEVIK